MSHRLITTLHSKVHPPLRPPNPLPKHAQEKHQEPRRRRDPRLRAQRLQRPVPRHPVDLYVRRHKPTHRPAHIDPRVHLAAALRVRVQEVGVERDGRDHDAGYLHGEEDGDDDPVVDALEGEAEDEHGDGHGGRGEPDDDEAGFGLDVARVAARVVVANGVVEPVAEDGADEGADDGGEVKEAWLAAGISLSVLSSFTCVHSWADGMVGGSRHTETIGRKAVDGSQPD